jgi:hypothetical protein
MSNPIRRNEYPNRSICCFCDEKIDCPYGNNPAPIANKGKCCGACNNIVTFARIGLFSIEHAKTELQKYKIKM